MHLEATVAIWSYTNNTKLNWPKILVLMNELMNLYIFLFVFIYLFCKFTTLIQKIMNIFHYASVLLFIYLRWLTKHNETKY